MESIRLLDLPVDVLHANDWQTGPDAGLSEDRISRACHATSASPRCFTIHNLAYQGQFWHWDMLLTGSGLEVFQLAPDGVLRQAQPDEDRPGLCRRDEHRQPALCRRDSDIAAGLRAGRRVAAAARRADGHHQWRRLLATGIRRPIRILPANYDVQTVRPRAKRPARRRCKNELGLPVGSDAPLVGFVGRLTDQKGIDLIAGVMQEWVATSGRAMGDLGHRRTEVSRTVSRIWPSAIRKRWPCGWHSPSDWPTASKAGADMFLMPSRIRALRLEPALQLEVRHRAGGASHRRPGRHDHRHHARNTGRRHGHRIQLPRVQHRWPWPRRCGGPATSIAQPRALVANRQHRHATGLVLEAQRGAICQLVPTNQRPARASPHGLIDNARCRSSDYNTQAAARRSRRQFAMPELHGERCDTIVPAVRGRRIAMHDVSLAFVWHQHQPYYPDDVRAKTPCLGSACTAPRIIGAWRCSSRKCPSCTPRSTSSPACSCNCWPTPSQGHEDEHLRVSRLPADGLTEQDMTYLLDNFFMVHPDQMIRPYPRYQELYQKRGLSIDSAARAAKRFTKQRHSRPAKLVEPDLDSSDGVRAGQRSGRVPRARVATGPKQEKKWLLEQADGVARARLIPLHRELAEARPDRADDHAVLSSDLAAAVRQAAGAAGHARRATCPSIWKAYRRRCRERRSAWPWPIHEKIFGAEAARHVALGRFGLPGDDRRRSPPRPAFNGSPPTKRFSRASTDGWVSRDGQGFLRNPEMLYRPWRVEDKGQSLQIDLPRSCHERPDRLPLSALPAAARRRRFSGQARGHRPGHQRPTPDIGRRW